MSWANPTKKEAEEGYYHYKNKYSNAAVKKRNSEKRESEYRAQKNAAINKRNELTQLKINCEKRLQGVETIIKMLTGDGGSVNVPAAISKGSKSLREMQKL